MEKNIKRGLMPLNIQLFAENVNDDESGVIENTPKIYSQEEYDNIVSEMNKIKKANDNLSKENAEYKRSAKEKMSKEEKELEAQKEKDKILQETQKELLSMKLSKEFVTAGFDDETCNELIKSFNDDDNVSFVKLLSQKIKTLVDNARKEEQENAKRNATLPPNGKTQSGLNPIVERYINSKNSNTNSAREMYLKK